MAGTGSEEHHQRALRAQQLSDAAREHASAECAAAERSERLVADAADPDLSEIHRRAAELHRQAQKRYERAADLQQSRAGHERRLVEPTHRNERAEPDVAVRDMAADRRDGAADERERVADLRDHTADGRENLADDRERLQDDRESRFLEAAGRSNPDERERLARAKAVLRRVEGRLVRRGEALERTDTRAERDEATIQREIAATERDPPSEATSPPA